MIPRTSLGHVGSIIERWRLRHEELTKLDATVKAAPLIDEMLADLESLAGAGDDKLNLTDAGHISGYSADHLSRLIRDKKLTNYGRKGAPRVRRSELPMRPASQFASRSGNTYSIAADVRSLGTRR